MNDNDRELPKDPQDWVGRWREGRTGFHQSETNPFLVRHRDALPGPPARILVPLCGKSQDMVWLRAQGYRVLGVELSELAVEAFFEEQGLTAVKDRHGPFARYQSEGIEILQGDFFALSAQLAGQIDGVFDRASVVALPPELREPMAKTLAEVLPTGAPMLLVSFDYPQHEMNPPPHAVPDTELQRVFGRDFDLALLSDNDSLANYPNFAAAGLSELHERVYRITRITRITRRA